MTTIRQILCFSLCLTASLQAQLPDAPIEARIALNNSSPYIKETFIVTLTIITRNMDIRQQLDLTDLPPPEKLSLIGAFEPMPIERRIDGPNRIETRRFQARARALKPGPVSLAPILQLTVQRRVRSLFGSIVEERPVSIRIANTSLTARPLPPSPDNFCGAVGTFKVITDATPTNLVAGDLVTVTTRITGEGFLDDLRIPAVHEAPLLKTYPIKLQRIDPRQRQFTQTVIPLSKAVDAIPELAFSVFDTAQGRYVTHRAGPFPLHYHDASTRVIEQFRPDAATNRQTRSGHIETGDWRQRLARQPNRQATCHSQAPARIAPSLRSLGTFTIPAGGTVELHDQHGDWLLIEFDGNRGWIQREHLTDD